MKYNITELLDQLVEHEGLELMPYEDSLGIYKLSWKNNIPDNHYNRGNVLVTGFSCRSQIQRFEGYRPLHPIQALLREI